MRGRSSRPVRVSLRVCRYMILITSYYITLMRFTHPLGLACLTHTPSALSTSPSFTHAIISKTYRLCSMFFRLKGGKHYTLKIHRSIVLELGCRVLGLRFMLDFCYRKYTLYTCMSYLETGVVSLGDYLRSSLINDRFLLGLVQVLAYICHSWVVKSFVENWGTPHA